MIIAKGRTRYEGNLVGWFKWQLHKCDVCNGTAMLKTSCRELVVEKLIYAHHIRNIGWKKMHQIVREWRANGRQIECFKCEGQGTWENKF